MFIESKKTGKKYYPVIGLEVHAELDTESKMFCRCKNDPFYGEPNTHICPVCTAQPGTLPYVNKEAVKSVLKFGLSVDADLADFTEFDRKNYFYPDIPKAYQISQLKYPLVSNGNLAGVDLTRVHLEEDTASSSHKTDHSLVDFNRAGVPLMELVTEPVVKSADQAMNFAKELQLLLRTLGISHANLEKGEMRIEANISVSEHENPENDPELFGTKTEVKNLNSFKIVGAAIDFELKRQIEAIESGEEVVQETRGWDENKDATFSQRKKENAADYRYFPDPDIPKYKLSEIEEFSKENLSKELPELPRDKRVRYAEEYELKNEDVEFFLQNPIYDAIFVNAAKEFSDTKSFNLLSNYISTDLIGLEKSTDVEGSLDNVTSETVTGIVSMINDGDLSSRGAKDTLIYIYTNGGDAKEVADSQGYIQKSDTEELKKLAEEIISENPEQTEQYKAGEEKLIQFFLGQAMKKTGGSVNPQLMITILKDVLS